MPQLENLKLDLITARALTTTKRVIQFLNKFADLLYQKVKRDQVSMLAASIAYTTVLAIVPIFIIFFSILGKLSTEAAMQGKIFNTLSGFVVPEFVGDVFSKLEELSDQAFQLSVVGLPLLMLVGVSLYLKVDHAINHIWGSLQRRKLKTSAMAFLMSVLIGPLLLIIAFSLPAYIQAFPYVKMISDTAMVAFLINLLPFCISSLIFFAIFQIVPLAQVKWQYSLLGGVCTAILVYLTNGVLAIYINNFSNYGLIYGSLSVLPIFLMWTYLIWSMILIGASICNVSQNYRSLLETGKDQKALEQPNINLAVGILICLTEQFNRQAPGLTLKELEEKLKIPATHLNKIIKRLIIAGVVTETNTENNNKYLKHYQPGISPEKITLNKLKCVFHTNLDINSNNFIIREALTALQIHPCFQQDINIQFMFESPESALQKIQQANSNNQLSQEV